MIELKKHPRDDQNRKYLITGVSLHADAGEFGSGSDTGGSEFFSCNFTCIDKEQQFRPARLTPKQVIQALRDLGCPITEATLATWRCRPGVMGSPPFQKFGRAILYPWGPMRTWAFARLSEPCRTSSEADSLLDTAA